MKAKQRIEDLTNRLNRYSYEYYVLDQPTIDDISFDGEACVISISTTSILGNLVIGHTIDEAMDII
ncbi:MAG: iron-sulfur cluster assembly scaffold protein, partial [Bacteroidales bacterium]|nr:iron-sulfur cluster assembly scaffold protein [Bacteroidales bacterium]